jgi:hypothetical protein
MSVNILIIGKKISKLILVLEQKIVQTDGMIYVASPHYTFIPIECSFNIVIGFWFIDLLKKSWSQAKVFNGLSLQQAPFRFMDLC